MATNPNAVREDLRQSLPADQNLPVKKMKYAAQVVWCVDPGDTDMMFSAGGLHGKRVAGGEGAKSALVTGQNPDWPSQLEKTDNIRLYVVAHGVKVSGAGPVQVKIGLGTPASTSNTKTASEFFPILRDFVRKAPSRKVRRISLSMCNSAGIQGQIPVAQSFAKSLADLSADLTTDLTGRMGDLHVNTITFPKASVDPLCAPHANPLYTVMVDDNERSVANAKKLVENFHHSRTYVFASGKAPELKSGYRD